MNPVGGAALVDVSLALCVILSFVGMCGLVMAPLRWIQAKLQARADARELHDRLASAAEHLPLPPKVPEIQIIPYQHEPLGPDRYPVRMIKVVPDPDLYTVEYCKVREAECKEMSAKGMELQARIIKDIQGTGGTRRQAMQGFLDMASCWARRGKLWQDSWARIRDHLEDAEDDEAAK